MVTSTAERQYNGFQSNNFLVGGKLAASFGWAAKTERYDWHAALTTNQKAAAHVYAQAHGSIVVVPSLLVVKSQC